MLGDSPTESSPSNRTAAPGWDDRPAQLATDRSCCFFLSEQETTAAIRSSDSTRANGGDRQNTPASRRWAMSSVSQRRYRFTTQRSEAASGRSQRTTSSSHRWMSADAATQPPDLTFTDLASPRLTVTSFGWTLTARPDEAVGRQEQRIDSTRLQRTARLFFATCICQNR